MASINQLVSELANALQQAHNVPARRGLRLAIIHARNTLIRQSFENHSYVDKSLQQRFCITLIDCPDGDLHGVEGEDVIRIKRSKDRIPSPVRLTNNLPFSSVRTVGFKNPIEVPFIKEASSLYYGYLPGMQCSVSYDYINGYLYINSTREPDFRNIEKIIIEAPFEYPIELTEEHFDNSHAYSDDDEFIIPEDMISNIKKLVLETFNPQIVRQTGEITSQNLAK